MVEIYNISEDVTIWIPYTTVSLSVHIFGKARNSCVEDVAVQCYYNCSSKGKGRFSFVRVLTEFFKEHC